MILAKISLTRQYVISLYQAQLSTHSLLASSIPPPLKYEYLPLPSASLHLPSEF
uniref:Uncharacterized protein n=1 Tax=Arundo donax TaxID=35708 RepID=A0A0A9EUJ7_ARUDO